MLHEKDGGQRSFRFYKNRLKLLFLTVLLLMLSSAVLVSLIPNAYASETSTHEKMLTILKDVVGLDLTKYTIETKEYPLDTYVGVLPQENVDYFLESSESRLRVSFTLVNKTLQKIYVSDCYGLPHMAQQAADVFEMADAFLSRYYAYSGAVYIQEMRNMLREIGINKNITKTSGNIRFEVFVSQIYTEFMWTYIFNGIQANSKSVSLGFEKGFLKHFADNWWLYKIGSTSINVDEKKAIEIAIKAAKNYSWKVYVDNDTWVEVTEFNIATIGKPTLSLLNYMSKEKARGGDPLTLYPEWLIPLGLDKIYPGGVTGINIGVWADTGEISYIGLITFGWTTPSDGDSNEPPSNEDASDDKIDTNPTLTVWMAIAILITVALGVTAVHLRRKPPQSVAACRNQTI